MTSVHYANEKDLHMNKKNYKKAYVYNYTNLNVEKY